MALTASSAPNKSLKMKNSRILDNYSTRFLPPWARRSQNTVRTVVRDAVNIEQFEVEVANVGYSKTPTSVTS
jgi:hypothetical protein